MRHARLVVKSAAAAADLVRRPQPGLVVLIYHRVGRRTAVEVDLPVELFEAQMRFLAEECRVVTLDEGLDLVTSQPSTRERLVAVTFDDGTADFADVAVPVLARFGVPATLYVATHFIEAGEEFPDGGAPVSWTGLRDACSTGVVQVGSHTHHHALLDRLPAPDVAEELDRSIGLIRDRLGVPPVHFAYPKAVLGSEHAQGQVRARFRSAALAGTRANRFGATDPFRLARSPVQMSDDMRWFVKKVHGGMALEDSLRRGLNRRRYVGATT